MPETRSEIGFPEERGDLAFTGERYVPGVTGQLCFEHYHRYLFALQFVEGKDVVDAACGEGYGSVVMSRRARSVVGLDIAEDVVTRAQSLYQSESCRFLSGTVHELPLPDGSADVVVSFETIEHVTNQSKVIQEFQRVLRASGLLIISTPNKAADDGAAHESNSFHAMELTRAEFVALLQQQFRNVRLLEQSFVHGTVIGTADKEAFREPELFTARSSSRFSHTKGGIGDSYFIAIASNADLPPAGWSVLNALFDFEKIVDDLRYSVGVAKQREERIAALEHELAEAKRRETLARIQAEHLRRRIDAVATKTNP